MIAKKVVQTSQSYRTKFNLEIAFFRNVQLRIDRAKGRNAYADNVGSVIPVDFSEESRVEF